MTAVRYAAASAVAILCLLAISAFAAEPPANVSAAIAEYDAKIKAMQEAFAAVPADATDKEWVVKKLQRYGTQGQCTGPGKWEPLPLEDPENVDQRRAAVGLPPLREYIAGFQDICK